MQTLLTSKSGEEIFEDEIAQWLQGKDYEELVRVYLRNGATILALRSAEELKVNPRHDMKIDEGSLIYIAKERIAPKR